MLLSLKIQFFFFSRSNHLPIASSQLLVIWLSWGSLNDTRGGKTRLEITGESKDRERRKEKGEEEGKRRRSRPKSERRENLARRSVGGRKEGSSGTRAADFYFCVSLIPLSFFRLFLGGSCLLRLLIFFICEPGERDIGSWEPDCIATGRHRVTMEGESRRNGRSLVILISLWKTCGFHR